MKNNIFDEIKRLKSVADIGLLYCSNEYDRARYLELQDISFQLLSKVSGGNIETLKESFPMQKDYPTAKVDIRGLLLSPGKKILLVKESADSKWSLPGGWADIGYSPEEIIVKEFREETGLDVIAETLLAVFDKRMHPHPPQPFYVYKMVFYCRAISTELVKGFDVSDVNYFDISNLPELSEDRILRSQVELLYKKVIESDSKAYFD